ncbi:rho guanine nucleotide exchange factor 10-like isoform X2 [Tubulanus polymorphus]|uniref:rho guanine nucleotide exchange factor 10-like isoform X2 n=1 Tax=Tubulanus polymorphus TaxID=672921 RepID=UPI003DA1EF61
MAAPLGPILEVSNSHSDSDDDYVDCISSAGKSPRNSQQDPRPSSRGSQKSGGGGGNLSDRSQKLSQESSSGSVGELYSDGLISDALGGSAETLPSDTGSIGSGRRSPGKLNGNKADYKFIEKHNEKLGKQLIGGGQTSSVFGKVSFQAEGVDVRRGGVTDNKMKHPASEESAELIYELEGVIKSKEEDLKNAASGSLDGASGIYEEIDANSEYARLSLTGVAREELAHQIYSTGLEPGTYMTESGKYHEVVDGPQELLDDEYYEPFLPPDKNEYSDSGGSWGSHEFETTLEYEQNLRRKDTMKMKAAASRESVNQLESSIASSTLGQTPTSTSNVLTKIKHHLSLSKHSSSDEETSDDDNKDQLYMPVFVNNDKHPPPALPPMPDGLTADQMKRRYIVNSIVESENSYMETLHRLVQDYERPLLESNPPILRRSKVKVIFHKLRDILHCHSMFQIALSEVVAHWDTEQKIGDCFTASFSKSMVFDIYSDFVNNFSQAMETAKSCCSKQGTRFAEFMNQCQAKSPDKLSLFGLMVKPVQRFPQFILILQDLLKNTDKEHADRLPLQLALTVLENLAHKLNDRKRESEQRHAANKLLKQLNVKFVQKLNSPNLHVIRQDDVVETALPAQEYPKKRRSSLPQVMKKIYNDRNSLVQTKGRRLFTLNNSLVVVCVHNKEADYGTVEKFHMKRMIPLRLVEVRDTVITPDTKVSLSGQPGRITISSARPRKKDESELYQQLDNLLHDFTVIGQISSMATSLKCQYEKLNDVILEEMSKQIQMEIQKLDEHLRTYDSSALQLIIRKKNGKNAKFLMNMDNAEVKQSWLSDLKTAKLIADERNCPGWLEAIEANEHEHWGQLPLFIKPMGIDITQQMDRVVCGIPFTLPSYHPNGHPLQHIWLCGGERNRSSVSIVMLDQERFHVTESFNVCKAAVSCVELVPGCGDEFDTLKFRRETIWMGTSSGRIQVHDLHGFTRGEVLLSLSLKSGVVSLRYLNDSVFAGLDCGDVSVIGRNEDGGWSGTEIVSFHLSSAPVSSLLPIDWTIWCACRNKIFVYDTDTLEEELIYEIAPLEGRKPVITHTVRAGVGLWVAFKNKAVLHLYHIETFRLLKDINIASAVPQNQLKSSVSDVMITALVASRGWLWIGTNSGHILTLPLPRLEGVPLVNGRPKLSRHKHDGPVTFIIPTLKQQTTMKPLMVKELLEKVDKSPSSDEKSTSVDEVDAPTLKRGIFQASFKGKFRLSAAWKNRSKTMRRASEGPTTTTTTNNLSRVNSCVADASPPTSLLKYSQKSKSMGNLLDLDKHENEYSEEDIQKLYANLMSEKCVKEFEDVLKRTPIAGAAAGKREFITKSDSHDKEENTYVSLVADSSDMIEYGKDRLQKHKKLTLTKQRNDSETTDEVDLCAGVYGDYNFDDARGGRLSDFDITTSSDEGDEKDDEEPIYDDFEINKPNKRMSAPANLIDASAEPSEPRQMTLERPFSFPAMPSSSDVVAAAEEDVRDKKKPTTPQQEKFKAPNSSKKSPVLKSFIVISGGLGYVDEQQKQHDKSNSSYKQDDPLILLWQCSMHA